MLIKILIIFFTFLIGYQLFLEVLSFIKNDNLVEGLENQLTTAEKNTRDIELIKGEINGLKTIVDTIPQNINSMQSQINTLVQQQADYALDLVGSQPITITGLQ
jgi:hypothetical protein